MNSSDPLIGSAIDGRYYLTARIARGGMATVYRARDSRLDRDVALKIIHPHLAEDPSFVERFIREARSAASLSSPHIVSVYDQGIARVGGADRAYLVMELMSGPNLRTELNSHGSLPIGAALAITRQVLRALAVAHAKNVIHRDVKPENILLESSIDTSAVMSAPKVNAKVADFGLARAASDPRGTSTGTLLGTVAYVPPELVTHATASPTSDIYSTGIMLYELIAGALPFEGETAIQIAFSHVNTPMPRLTELAQWMPAGIDSLIALFTSKDPAKRPATASAAIDALDDVAASVPDELRFRRIPVFPSAQPVAPAATAVLERSEAPTAPSHNPPSQATIALPQVSRGPVQPTARLDVGTGTTTELRQARPATRKRRWPAVVVLLILLAAAATGAWWYFTKGPGLRIEVPAVAGETTVSAEKSILHAQLQSKIESAYSDTVAKDTVIGTDPEAGTKIHPSRVVTIIVSRGIEQVEVPDVVGKKSEDAQNALTEGRLSPEIAEEYSEDVPAGEVITQKPAAGNHINHDSTVTITVSKGRQPIEIRDYTGSSGEVASGELRALGFAVDVKGTFSDTVPEGEVISQKPASGTGYKGDTITLTVSKGPELVEVPSVFGKQKDNAVKELEKAGFKIKVEVDALWGEVFGTVRAQSPAAGEKVKKGSTITINVV